MHNIHEMPNFPHSVMMKSEKVEENIMMVHNAGDPLFEESNFGTTGMNGESLPSLCPFGTAAEQQVEISQSISEFRYPYYMFQVPLMTLHPVGILPILQVLF